MQTETPVYRLNLSLIENLDGNVKYLYFLNIPRIQRYGSFYRQKLSVAKKHSSHSKNGQWCRDGWVTSLVIPQKNHQWFCWTCRDV